MKRRNTTPAIPPFLDNFGRPTYENPFGRYRPNPALTANVRLTAPIVEPLPVAIVEPVVATSKAAPRPVRVPRQLPRVHQPSPVASFASSAPQPPLADSAPTMPSRAERLAEQVAERRVRLHRRIRRTVAVLVAGGSGLVGVSAASAYFTAGGSGTGAATTGTLSISVVSATVSSKLIPGGSSSLSVELSKPNSALTLTGVAPGPGNIQVTTGTCATPDITVATNNSLNIPVGTGTDVTVPIPNGVSMGTGATADCQNATFSIPVTVTVQTP